MNAVNKELNNVAEVSQLFDLYGGLLTEKKRQVMELYYEDDMSLAEIAEEFNVSRAAVHDSLKSAEKSLRQYEEKLGLLSEFTEREKTVAEVLTELESLLEDTSVKDNKKVERQISKIKKMLNKIVD